MLKLMNCIKKSTGSFSIVCVSYKVGERFKEGQEGVEDDPRSGWPSTSQIDENMICVRNLSYGVVVVVLGLLGLRAFFSWLSRTFRIVSCMVAFAVYAFGRLIFGFGAVLSRITCTLHTPRCITAM